jgi:DNA-binding MarR family transcriptional regulator
MAGSQRPNHEMKIVVRKGMKLDMPHVLGFVATYPLSAKSAILIPALERRFGCKRRAAQDALAILIAGGWVQRLDDATDRRRKVYRVTPQGRRDLEVAEGLRRLRRARWFYSRTSTRARNRRKAHGEYVSPVLGNVSFRRPSRPAYASMLAQILRLWPMTQTRRSG